LTRILTMIVALGSWSLCIAASGPQEPSPVVSPPTSIQSPPVNTGSDSQPITDILPAPPGSGIYPSAPFSYGCMPNLFDWWDAFFYSEDYSQFQGYFSCSDFANYMPYMMTVGGGFGPIRRPQDTASNTTWRAVLGLKLKGFAASHCAAVIGNVYTNKLSMGTFSAAKFVSAAGAQSFYNGTTSASERASPHGFPDHRR